MSCFTHSVNVTQKSIDFKRWKIAAIKKGRDKWKQCDHSIAHPTNAPNEKMCAYVCVCTCDRWCVRARACVCVCVRVCVRSRNYCLQRSSENIVRSLTFPNTLQNKPRKMCSLSSATEHFCIKQRAIAAPIHSPSENIPLSLGVRWLWINCFLSTDGAAAAVIVRLCGCSLTFPCPMHWLCCSYASLRLKAL